MKVLIGDTMGTVKEFIKDINTLEDIVELMKEHDNDVILTMPYETDIEKGIELEIEIYNGWRE